MWTYIHWSTCKKKMHNYKWHLKISLANNKIFDVYDMKRKIFKQSSIKKNRNTIMSSCFYFLNKRRFQSYDKSKELDNYGLHAPISPELITKNMNIYSTFLTLIHRMHGNFLQDDFPYKTFLSAKLSTFLVLASQKTSSIIYQQNMSKNKEKRKKEIISIIPCEAWKH